MIFWYQRNQTPCKEGRLGKTSSFFFVLSLSPNHLEEEKQIRLIVLSSAAKKKFWVKLLALRKKKNFKKEKSFFVNSEIGFSLSKNHNTVGTLCAKLSSYNLDYWYLYIGREYLL